MTKLHQPDKLRPVNSFVRGGQVTIHQIKMFGQVIKGMIWFTIFFSAAFGTYRMWNQWDRYEWSVSRSFYLAKFDMEMNDNPDASIAFEWPPANGRRFGEIGQARVGDILDNPGITALKDAFVSKVQWAYLYAFLIALMVDALGVLYFVLRGHLMARKKVLEGSELVGKKQLQKAIKKWNANRPTAIRTPPVRLGDLTLPIGVETMGIGVIGSVGVQKTSIIRDFIHDARRQGRRAIIYDKMGTLVEEFFDPKKGDIILNPFDARSPSWNIFDDVRMPSDLRLLATAFLPDKGAGNDPTWITGARLIFEKVGLRLMNTPAARNDAFAHALLKLSMEDLSAMLAGSSAASLVDPSNPRAAGSFRITLASWLDPLERLPCDGPCFSIRDFIENDDGHGFIFMPSRSDIHPIMKPVISAQIEVCVNALLALNQSPTRRIQFVLDELNSLQELPSLDPLLSEVRQFGGATLIGFHNKAQLDKIYGEPLAKALMGNCRTKFIFATGEGELAKWCQAQLGKQRTQEYLETLTYGVQDVRDSTALGEKRELNDLVVDSTIMGLPAGSCFVRFPDDLPVARLDFPYRTGKVIAKRFVPRLDVLAKKPLTERDDTMIAPAANPAASSPRSGSGVATSGSGGAGIDLTSDLVPQPVPSGSADRSNDPTEVVGTGKGDDDRAFDLDNYT